MNNLDNHQAPPYRLVDKVVSAEEQQRGREIAAAQLQEMFEDPEEWASYVREIEFFTTGHFARGE